MSDFSWEACSLSTFKSVPLSMLYKLHLTQQSFWKCVPLFSSGKAPFLSSISAPLLQNTSLEICAHKEIALSSCKSCLFLFSPKLSFGLCAKWSLMHFIYPIRVILMTIHLQRSRLDLGQEIYGWDLIFHSLKSPKWTLHQFFFSFWKVTSP